MINILYLVFFSILFPFDNTCSIDNNFFNFRSLYSVDDTISIDDQNLLYPVCNGNGDYLIGDFFSFNDLNGNSNGGDYKITIISMNATW